MLQAPITPSPVGKLAFSYVRMSTAQQMQGDSLRRQLAASRAFADEHGLILDDTLRDIGVSAWTGRNSRDGALGHFLRLADEGRVPRGSYLIVESLDRISREQVVDALQLFLQILQTGITIVTLADRQIYSRDSVGQNFHQLLISLTIMARAHEESQIKSMRISAAHRRRTAAALKGETFFTHNTPAWITRSGNNKTSTFALNEHAVTVRRIFELTADGVGQRVIARRLNDEGVAAFTARGNGWHQSTIPVILTSVTARGQYAPIVTNEDGTKTQLEPIDGYYPAAVSDELWQRAHNAKRLPPSRGRKGKTFTNLFTGLATCAGCGGSMALVNNGAPNGNRRHYFCCYNNIRGGCTRNKRFRYEDWETCILDHVREFRLHELFASPLQDERLTAIREQTAACELRVVDLDRRIANLRLSLETADPETMPGTNSTIKERQAQKQAEERALLQLRNDEATILLQEQSARFVEEDIARMREEWLTDDLPTRYKLRQRCHLALKSFIDVMQFDSKDNSVIVGVVGGVKAYRFADFELRDTVDLLPRTQPGSARERALTNVPHADTATRMKRVRDLRADK